MIILTNRNSVAVEEQLSYEYTTWSTVMRFHVHALDFVNGPALTTI